MPAETGVRRFYRSRTMVPISTTYTQTDGTSPNGRHFLTRPAPRHSSPRSPENLAILSADSVGHVEVISTSPITYTQNTKHAR